MKKYNHFSIQFLDFWIILPFLWDIHWNFCLNFLFNSFSFKGWTVEELPNLNVFFVSQNHKIKYRAASIPPLIYGLERNNKVLILIFITIHSISHIVAFPLLIERTAKRIGENYIIVGTGMIYYFSQISNASTFYILGILMNDEARIETLYALIFTLGATFLGFIFAIIADFNTIKTFGVDRRNTMQIIKRAKQESTEWSNNGNYTVKNQRI